MKQPLYKAIASRITAYQNCIMSNNKEWEGKHYAKLLDYNDLLPSGSGFDSGSKIDIDHSTGDKILITTSFHFMDENGYYDGWEDYTLTIVPSLQFDFTIRFMRGRNRDEIKDYIYELFDSSLREVIE